MNDISLSKEGLEDLQDRLEEVQGTVLNVGVPRGNTYPDGTSVSLVAAVHEYGWNNNVERAWLRRGTSRRETRSVLLASKPEKVFEGEGADGDEFLNALKEGLLKSVRDSLKEAGLHDTGTLLDSLEAGNEEDFDQ